MRLVPIAFLSIVCLVLVGSLFLCFRYFYAEVEGVAIAYLISLLCSHFTLLVGSIGGEDFTRSRTYQDTFFALMMVSAALGILVAAKFSDVHPWWLTVAAGLLAAGFQATSYLVFQFHLGAPLYKATKLTLLDGALHAALGAIVLLSLAAPVRVVGGHLRLCIGLYMVLRGTCGFAFAQGAIRQPQIWEGRNEWVPMMPAVISYGLLVAFLAFAQRELSHQPLELPAVYPVQMEEIEQ